MSMYTLPEIEPFMPGTLVEQLGKVISEDPEQTYFDQYSPAADRTIERETGYTEADLIDPEHATAREDLLVAYAGILTKLAMSLIGGYSNEMSAGVDSDYVRAMRTLARLQKPEKVSVDPNVGSVTITGLPRY